jgi:protein gp37
MSKIEWCDKTWNPITGCTPISEGCENCYAAKMAKRLKGRFGYPAYKPFSFAFHADKMEQPGKWKKPKRIFVGSMTDMGNNEMIPWKAFYQVMNVCREQRHHTFMLLTKRPEDLLESLDPWMSGLHLQKLPKNIWVGVTAENQQRAAERLPVLAQIPAAVRFVSVEPMLEPVSITGYNPDWVICGAETGAGARPMDLKWSRNLHAQCAVMSIPFFMKKTSDGDPPSDLMIRQFPEGGK